MPGRYSFPKRVRLLRSTDFRRVYDQGSRFSGPMFAAFCLRGAVEDGSRLGFTVPRALGKAVVRNRIKRRMREAVRMRLDGLNQSWSIVINPRSRSLTAPTAELEREVERLFQRCNGSS
jgi:ribonuclease P protein component